MGIIINGQNDTIGPVDNTMSLLGTVSIGGTMTIEDFTNIDSVGLGTFRSGIDVTGGNVKIGTTTAGQSEADDLTIATSAHTGMTIRSGATSKGAVYFSDGTSGNNEFRGVLEYNHSDDHFRIFTAASESLRITSAGNVGIGSDNPQNKLDVAGDVKILDNSPRLFFYDANANGASSATGGFEVYDKDGNKNVFVGAFAPNADNLIFGVTGSERARITSAGGVGIGTDTPYANNSFNSLSIGGSGKYGLIELNKSDGVAGSWIDVYGTNGNGDLRITTAGTSGAITFWTGGSFTERLRITSAGRVGVNIDSPNTVLHIKSTQNSDGLTVTKGSNVSAFLGHNGSGDEGLLTLKEGGTTRIQLYAETGQNSYINSGNLGIGINSPSTKLDVRPTAENPTTGSPAAGSFLQIRADDATVGKGPSLALMNLSGSKETGWRLSALTASGNNGDFTIHGYGGGATYSERLRITSDGKTGIGGITPQNLLNVNATGSMGLYGTTTGKAGHSIRFIRKYGSGATHNFAVVNGASPHGQSRLGGFVATYTFRSAYGFDSDGGGHGVRMLSGRVRDSGEWGFDTETNYGTGDSPRPTLQGVDNSDGTCTLQVVNPGSTHSYGEFHIVAWDCQITTPST